MDIVIFLGIVLLAYLIGSIPFGLIVVKLATGEDIRQVQSGRTGGTNAMRAAGFWAGLSTAVLDIFKGASTVWIARALIPGDHLLEIFTAIFAILGHNYSIYLIERDENGKLRFRGGAGGAIAIGGAMAFWAPSIFIIVPLGALILFGLGYASVATMSIPLMIIIMFSIRAALGFSPWIYVLYGVLAELILLFALRPNIKRLINGKERLVGWRAKRAKTSSETALKNT
jgi:glycerol-3-phosphate acyltransferase PlsY